MDTGRSSSSWRDRVDTGSSSGSRGAETGGSLRTPVDDNPLRGRVDSGGLSGGRLGGNSTDLGSARDSGGLRSRPTTSTAGSGRSESPILDAGRAVTPAPRRTPFPSMYRPAPDTLSGARITAMERLESQRAQRRLEGAPPRADDRSEARSIAERYSRESSRGTDARPSSSDPLAGLSGARGNTLSRARIEGLSRHRDSARVDAAGGLRSARPQRAEGTGSSARDVRARYERARSQDPEAARRSEKTARAAAIASDTAFRTALGATKVLPGVPGHPSTGGGWSDDVALDHGYTGDYGRHCYSACNWYWYSWYPSFCFSWWGSGWWWGACWGWGWGGYYPWRCSYGWYPYSYCYPYYGYYYPWYYPTYYAYSAPVVYQTVYYGDSYYGEEYVDPGYAVEEAPVEAAPAQVAPPAPRADAGALMGRATAEYLNLGDRAFAAGEYGKAVKYYAKAVEYSPGDGVLYLVLSDALFATGDYHYAAYALRRALELAPDLAQVVVDKRQFYGDPADFDRQLALLETYLNDHFLDDDARLLLAANYLFGAMPHKCVELLESPFSVEVKGSAAGALILSAAQSALAAQR